MNFDTEPEHEHQLRQERNAFEDMYYGARKTITELRRVINRQARYIAELEKQLEYANPGVVKEVQEFLETRGLL